MLRVLLSIVFLLSGCASSKHDIYSATKMDRRDGGDILDQIQEGFNSVVSGGTKQEGMLIVNLAAQYDQKNGKWPETAEDLIFNDGSAQNQKVSAKNVKFIPKDNNELIIKYTNYRGYTDGIILGKRKDGDAYVFCFMMDPNKECNNFLAVSIKN